MKPQRRTVEAAGEPRPADEERNATSGEAGPRTFLVERACDAKRAAPRNTNADGADTSVVIAVIADPERLLRERGLAFHGDVVDLLTDLIIEAMGRDGESVD